MTGTVNPSLPQGRQGGLPKHPKGEEVQRDTSCGLRTTLKIVGGSKAGYGNHPWMVGAE